jgi:hypothetical protein
MRIGKMAVGQIGPILGGKNDRLVGCRAVQELRVVHRRRHPVRRPRLRQRGIVVAIVAAKVSIFCIRLYAIELSLHGRPGRFAVVQYRLCRSINRSIDRTNKGVIGNEKR